MVPDPRLEGGALGGAARAQAPGLSECLLPSPRLPAAKKILAFPVTPAKHEPAAMWKKMKYCEFCYPMRGGEGGWGAIGSVIVSQLSLHDEGGDIS